MNVVGTVVAMIVVDAVVDEPGPVVVVVDVPDGREEVDDVVLLVEVGATVVDVVVEGVEEVLELVVVELMAVVEVAVDVEVDV